MFGEDDQATDPLTRDATAMPPPGGLGLAVGFDWALAAQITFQVVVSSWSSLRGPGGSLSPLVGLVGALPCLILGESLRRGYAWARWVQIAINTLGFFGGLALLSQRVQQPKSLFSFQSTSLVVLLFLSPWIAWRLMVPRTSRWFAQATRAQALARHSGSWLLGAVVGSAIAGVVVALSQRGR